MADELVLKDATETLSLDTAELPNLSELFAG